MPDPLSWNRGLGMNVAVNPAARGHVLHDVLVEHELVGHDEQRVELHVDLGLAGGGHLVVLDLDLDAEALHGEDHLRAQVLEVVGRGDREVALLGADLVAEVGPLVGAGVPVPFDRVDLVEGVTLVLGVPDVVEDEELGLGPEVAGVGQARRPEIRLGLGAPRSEGHASTARGSPGRGRSS